MMVWRDTPTPRKGVWVQAYSRGVGTGGAEGALALSPNLIGGVGGGGGGGPTYTSAPPMISLLV